jgi:hypothetical protein
VSSRLLPFHAQVATYIGVGEGFVGSNLVSVGSRQVAGWVAGWIWKISLIYGHKRLTGSKGSTFINKLRVEKIGEREKRIGVTVGISCYTCYPGMQADSPNVGGET